MENIIELLSSALWSLPLIVIIIGIGLFFTFKLSFIGVKELPEALRLIFKKEDRKEGISSFSALCTFLSAALGTGNIVGVGAAVTIGGPGAIFWMCVAAFLGMATTYAEAVLAVKYRKGDRGKYFGGPFHYIEKATGRKRSLLSKLYALFAAGAGLFGIGTAVQSNSIAVYLQGFFDTEKTLSVLSIPLVSLLGATLTAIFCFLVIVGGAKRIARTAEKIIPFLTIIYIGSCFIIIFGNVNRLPGAFVEIIKSAFGLDAVSGGIIGTMLVSMRTGISRGVFTNEAGLGTAAIAAASANTDSAHKQGLFAMCGTFIDTIVMCTLTGLCILVSGALPLGQNGSEATAMAFKIGFGSFSFVGSFILTFCLVVFAFASIIGWYFYASESIRYLFGGETAVKVYRILYVLAVFIGPFIRAQTAFALSDIFNALMAMPNLLALFMLRKDVVLEKRLQDGKKRQGLFKGGLFVQYKQKSGKKFVQSGEKRETAKLG